MNNRESTLSKSLINFSYLGVPDDTITAQLIEITESYLKSIGDLKGLSKKVPFLIAESFQNVIRHGIQIEKEINKNLREDFFQIDFLRDRVILSTVNRIKQEDVAQLEKKIDAINELSPEELKSLYIEVLGNGGLSSKGGAGLGIIEMARKSGMPLKKKFVEFDSEMSTFFLGVEIIKKTASSNSFFNISRTEEQYNTFLKEGVLLQYNGHFSKEINFPLIEILERNFVDSDKMNSEVAENMTIIIEVIQNASKHGMLLNDVRVGALAIHSLDNQLFIRCDNFINSDDYEKLKEYLERVKSMNNEELKKQRNRTMLEEALTENGDGGLGLIEIALFCQNTFKYSFRKMLNKHYLYSIEIKLKSNG